jgi:hypothetical protein
LADSKFFFFCGLAKAKSVHLVGQTVNYFYLSRLPGRIKICIWQGKTLTVPAYCQTETLIGRARNTFLSYWRGKKANLPIGQAESLIFPIGQAKKTKYSYWPGKND